MVSVTFTAKTLDIARCNTCGELERRDELAKHALSRHGAESYNVLFAPVEASIPPEQVDHEVEALAGELYTAAAAIKQQAADESAHLRTKDRNGKPKPHVLQPWNKVSGQFRQLWLDRARKQLER